MEVHTIFLTTRISSLMQIYFFSWAAQTVLIVRRLRRKKQQQKMQQLDFPTFRSLTIIVKNSAQQGQLENCDEN